jgi:hypothetical protein
MCIDSNNRCRQWFAESDPLGLTRVFYHDKTVLPEPVKPSQHRVKIRDGIRKYQVEDEV